MTENTNKVNDSFLSLKSKLGQGLSTVLEWCKNQTSILLGIKSSSERTKEDVLLKMKPYFENFNKTSQTFSREGFIEDEKVIKLQKDLLQKTINDNKFYKEIFLNNKKAEMFANILLRKDKSETQGQGKVILDKGETKKYIISEEDNLIYTFMDKFLDNMNYTDLDYRQNQVGYKVLESKISEDGKADLENNDTIIKAKKYKEFLDNDNNQSEYMVEIIQLLKENLDNKQQLAEYIIEDECYDGDIYTVINGLEETKGSTNNQKTYKIIMNNVKRISPLAKIVFEYIYDKKNTKALKSDTTQ